MPYKTRDELPENVRGVLPEHTQDIFKDAFNNAWEECNFYICKIDRPALQCIVLLNVRHDCHLVKAAEGDMMTYADI